MSISSIKDVSNIKWLQSGGYADVFLLDGIVYKIFNKPKQELLEFDVVKYLLDNINGINDISHICQYYSCGYMNKGDVLDLYKSCVGQKLDVNVIIDNFRCYNSVPYVSMEYVPGMDGLVSFLLLSHVCCLTSYKFFQEF